LDNGVHFTLTPPPPPAKDPTLKCDTTTQTCDTTYTATVALVNNYATETTSDTSSVFLLRYRKNYIAENNMAIGVNSFGLLSVTHADSINKFDQIASNIAIDAASIGTGAGFVPQAPAGPATQPLTTNSNISGPSYNAPSDNQVIISNLQYTSPPPQTSRPIDNIITCHPGSYSILFDPNDINRYMTDNKIDPANIDNFEMPVDSSCGLTITVKRLFSQYNLKDSFRITGGSSTEDKIWYGFNGFRNTVDIFNFSLHSGNSIPGLFYKQDLPYLVTVKHDNAQSQFVALSPNESKIFLAPITKTAFSDNISDITMANGVVLSLKENTDSELLALSKIPSDILGAYTNATGQIFSALGTVVTNQNTGQASELSLLKTKININNCQIALAQNPLAGLTGTSLATAQSNIHSACGN